MRKLVNQLSLFFIMLGLSMTTHAQRADLVTEQILVDHFNHKLSPQIRLFNGPSYLGYGGKLLSSPYFSKEIKFDEGDVVYDGYLFKKVPLMYDLVKQKLISLAADSVSEFTFINDRVSYFKLLDRQFINLPRKDNKGTVSNTGFFEQAYNGKIKVLIKHDKQVKDIVDTYGARKDFPLKSEYFVLLANDDLIKINSEKSFINLFPSLRNEMKIYIKKNQLKFKKNPVETLVELGKFYDRSSN